MSRGIGLRSRRQDANGIDKNTHFRYSYSSCRYHTSILEQIFGMVGRL